MCECMCTCPLIIEAEVAIPQGIPGSPALPSGNPEAYKRMAVGFSHDEADSGGKLHGAICSLFPRTQGPLVGWSLGLSIGDY